MHVLGMLAPGLPELLRVRPHAARSSEYVFLRIMLQSAKGLGIA